MSARKTRPTKGTPVSADMSHRDVASCLGISTAALSRWMRLATIPEDDFNAIFASLRRPISDEAIINLYQRRDMSARKRQRACPHCGKPLATRRASKKRAPPAPRTEVTPP